MPHIHEKMDFTASVYIVNDGAVFLHLHKKTGKWLPAGGHVELNEDPNEAVLREAKEETGLDIELVGERNGISEGDGHTELLPPRFLNRHKFLPEHEHEHVDLVYFGRAGSRNVIVEDGTEYRWFTREELNESDNNLLPTIKYYAKAALDSVL